MAWVNGVADNLFPALIVMSVLALLFPKLRKAGVLRGIGAAVAAALVVAVLVVLFNLNEVSVDCSWWVGPFPAGGPIRPCTGANSLPLWVTSLPALAGVAVFLGWIARRIRPFGTTLMAVTGLPILAAAIIAVGQASEAVAVAGVAAAGAVGYFWPRLRGQEEENRRTARAIQDWVLRWLEPDAAQTDAGALAVHPRTIGPEGTPVELVTYADGDATACRRELGWVLNRLIELDEVRPADVVVLTPQSPTSSWLVGEDGAPVTAGRFRLMPDSGPPGSAPPPITEPSVVRVTTIDRYKGLESPVVLLAEIDSRIAPEDLGRILYAGATRARTHLVVIGSSSVVQSLESPSAPARNAG